MSRFALIVALVVAASCGRIEFVPQPDAAPPGVPRPLRGYLLGGLTASTEIWPVDVGPDHELVASSLPATDAGAPVQFLLGTSRGVLYATTTTGLLLTYASDPATGGLSLIDSDPVGMDPWMLKLHPNGRWLYVSNWAASGPAVYGFEIGGDGTLTPLPSPTLTTGYSTIWLDIHPGGRWLVASDDDFVRTFSIDADGALSDTGAMWKANASGAWVVMVDSTGTFGYVAPDTSGGVPGFRLDPATGALAGIPGTPFVDGASVTFSATADRTGHNFYFANQGNLLFTAYTYDEVTGALRHLQGSPIDLGPSTAIFVAASPDSDDVYVSTNYDVVHQFRWNGTSIDAVRTFTHPAFASGQLALVPAFP